MGYNTSGKCIVTVDSRYFRPAEVNNLLGDPSKARKKLGWEAKVLFQELVTEMVREDLKATERDELVRTHCSGAICQIGKFVQSAGGSQPNELRG